MIRPDPKKIFFESDRFQVKAKDGDTLTVEVTRSGTTFDTTITKADFSPRDQEHFEDVVQGSRLQRGSCHFTLVRKKR